MPETTAPVPPWIPAPRPTGSGAVDQSVALWSALAGLGLREAVLAPGSRSAPLVYALAAGEVDGRIRAHVRIDERAAAYTALGIGRHDPARPAAVVTTSGTATAHLHAAVMEAHHSRIPLLVLTADRPAELREVGANQTTRQAGLFGSLVRLAVDLPAPAAEAASATELRTAVSTAARALAVATGEHPGPVHLNLSFRDPLVPRPLPAEPGPAPARIVLTRRTRPAPPTPEPVPVDARTVVVAGDGAGAAAAELAERHHLPLLAEPMSGARHGTTLVPGHPALLREVMADDRHPLRPSRALVLGRPTLSRSVVGALLGAEDVEVIVVDPGPDWPDVARRAQRVVPAAVGEETGPVDLPARQRHLAAWRTAATAAAAALPDSWQRRAALAVWEASTAQDVLVLGSSSLVRDLEQHAGTTRARVIANRGLAGIDGTTAMAGGIALAQERAATGAPGRVRLLVGDLTALHDLTGLLVGPEEPRPALDVIVVDDGGGRIFSGLEHAAAPPALLRRFFTTPHGADIAAAATALGAPAQLLPPSALPAALSAAGEGLRVLVVQETPREVSNNS
ncbi:2-succinyl-5-enolpyruvyl-6-hydroxy-3-cyclohexene-1-carboxylic-acid synthase [Brachybacterium saurashtrense]|uniref:2-succinyl-5-enolpyruvyl-6-hydroxy-3-cyclohexene-1-carboxylate synthase n=1 Tax=Brachybacterium saurashtrense TaxID=556288 RepID=A0A345YPH9_9MICO|nr:2-succinyl-5-enolpyruvyl-6-hydroxy-3-cyclohexene-1-carboxylic-acid synthase [Brachybacterium saurashtrense]AXK45831.1 2-succinyl-5-enolpyruvyl-6-hydroxy-3-cyclohexene-1-carboxylic-acid synthase [Brachybacterium saurashtrense]RRR24850.1 2-succinyl-5-enolpyruvyl-6-hydroxy-3-cyclohexene-1-carboxylic-acid synthase [Brachybacterium saurashtrense]